MTDATALERIEKRLDGLLDLRAQDHATHQQMSHNLGELTRRVTEQNGRVGKAETEIVRIQIERAREQGAAEARSQALMSKGQLTIVVSVLSAVLTAITIGSRLL